MENREGASPNAWTGVALARRTPHQVLAFASTASRHPRRDAKGKNPFSHSIA